MIARLLPGRRWVVETDGRGRYVRLLASAPDARQAPDTVARAVTTFGLHPRQVAVRLTLPKGARRV